MPRLNPPFPNNNDQEHIKAIVGSPSNWLVRWGISIIFLFILSIALVASFLKYPDIISAPIILTTEQPVIRIVTPSNGSIEQLFVTNQQQVTKGESIALINSDAKWEDIQQLDSFIQQLLIEDQLSTLTTPKNLLVGEIQNQYAQLLQQIEDYQFSIKQNLKTQKINIIQSRIEQYKLLNRSLDKQTALFKKEVELTRNNYEQTLGLYKEGAASYLEVENTESLFLRYQRELEEKQSNSIRNNLAIKDLEEQLLDIRLNNDQKLRSLITKIEESARIIRNAIDKWEQSFLIRAPINGQISLSKIWSPQQYVSAGTEIFSILPTPNDEVKFLAKGSLSSDGVGKIQVGSPAKISFNSFPQQEFGVLNAQLSSIAIVPEQDANGHHYYPIELELYEGLRTTYNKEIPSRQELIGTADIITEDRSILERVLGQFFDLALNQ